MLDLLLFSCQMVLLALSLGSLLNLSTHPHWFIRGWDFPRLQILVVGFAAASLYLIADAVWGGERWGFGAWSVLSLLAFLILWHGYRVLPYTWAWRKQTLAARSHDPRNSLRLVISNVQMDNQQYGKWIATIQRERPDVVLLLEVNNRWMRELEDWRRLYAHEIACPQENCYGMLLVCQFRIEDRSVQFIVQDDIPSIDATIRMPSGETVRLIGVHPRPPEPIRGTDSAPRDAEMMLHAERLETEKGPLLIGGDFNDVAWSRTTRLFLRVSQLLDPRRGRGLLNSFHAQHWYLRFPLDHVFHSPHFTLGQLRRLPEVGSDHFPILIEVQLEPEMRNQQDSLTASQEDEELADELIEREEEHA